MRRHGIILSSAALFAALGLAGCSDAADTEVNVPDVNVPSVDAPDVPETIGPSTLSLPAR